MKKVLFLQSNLRGQGGIEKVLPLVAKELSSFGYETNALSFYKPLNDGGVFTNEMALNESLSRGRLNQLKKAFYRVKVLINLTNYWKIDVIISSTPGATLLVLGLVKLKILRLPVVVYLHQALSVSDKGYFTLLKFVFKSASGFICVSEGVANEVKNLINEKEIPVEVVYNPVKFKKVSPLKQTYKKPILVTASRLETVKGVDVLVEVFVKYFKAHEGTLLILGEGSLKKPLLKKVQDHNLSKKILFLGEIDFPQEYMASANAYVSMARSEAFGVSLIEALSLGLPLVATDADYGPREIMQAKVINKYPDKNSYGYLLPKINLKDNTDVAANKIWPSFLQIMNDLTNVPESFNTKELITRAKQFAPENSVPTIANLLETVLNKNN